MISPSAQVVNALIIPGVPPPGITRMIEVHDLALYRETHPRRDMTYAQIAQAVSRLQRPGLPLSNTFHNLNMWREPSRRERLGDLWQNGDHAVVWIF
jgi:hypothetical protein